MQGYPTMTHCCDMMHANTTDTCPQHKDRFDCADALVHQWENNVYGLIVHDGGRSTVRISFCPWCGSKLPDKPN